MPAVIRFVGFIVAVAASAEAFGGDAFPGSEPAPFPSSTEMRQLGTTPNAPAAVAGQRSEVLPPARTGIAYPASHQLPAREPDALRPSAGGRAAAPLPATADNRTDEQKQLKDARPALQLARPGSADGRPAVGKASSLLTMLASLGIVLGIFLLLAWLLRRNMPKTQRPLPASVVEVLGRAPLVGRQQMHLLRFGNKLLLVSVSPGATDTIAELTDPLEVDRIAGLCQQSQPTAATEVFRQVLGQFSSSASLDTQSSKLAKHSTASKSARLGAALEDDYV